MSLCSYDPGDIIQANCQPLFKTTDKTLGGSGKVCEHCFTSGKKKEFSSLKRCAGCNIVFYCSDECKTEDWLNGHEIECRSQTFRNILKSDRVNWNVQYQLFRAMAFLVMNPEAAGKQYKVYN